MLTIDNNVAKSNMDAKKKKKNNKVIELLVKYPFTLSALSSSIEWDARSFEERLSKVRGTNVAVLLAAGPVSLRTRGLLSETPGGQCRQLVLTCHGRRALRVPPLSYNTGLANLFSAEPDKHAQGRLLSKKRNSSLHSSQRQSSNKQILISFQKNIFFLQLKILFFATFLA